MRRELLPIVAAAGAKATNRPAGTISYGRRARGRFWPLFWDFAIRKPLWNKSLGISPEKKRPSDEAS
jgi:hypothetical protein